MSARLCTYVCDDMFGNASVMCISICHKYAMYEMVPRTRSSAQHEVYAHMHSHIQVCFVWDALCVRYIL